MRHILDPSPSQLIYEARQEIQSLRLRVAYLGAVADALADGVPKADAIMMGLAVSGVIDSPAPSSLSEFTDQTNADNQGW
jgi:hypothetical protein